jgi:hypothetical protein
VSIFSCAWHEAVWEIVDMSLILDVFTKLRKATINFTSFHLSAHMEQLGSHWKDFDEFCRLLG